MKNYFLGKFEGNKKIKSLLCCFVLEQNLESESQSIEIAQMKILTNYYNDCHVQQYSKVVDNQQSQCKHILHPLLESLGISAFKMTSAGPQSWPRAQGNISISHLLLLLPAPSSSERKTNYNIFIFKIQNCVSSSQFYWKELQRGMF